MEDFYLLDSEELKFIKGGMTDKDKIEDAFPDEYGNFPEEKDIFHFEEEDLFPEENK